MIKDYFVDITKKILDCYIWEEIGNNLFVDISGS